MDLIIPLGQKNTLAEYMILSGAGNRLPMLDKDLYDSWKSRMELYMQNKEQGRMILESVENSPLVWPTVEENGVTRTKKYAKLSAAEKIQADCDMKSTNVIIQGLPVDIYSLVNHHRVAKDLWERVQLLMQDTSLTRQEREYLHTTNFDQLHAYLEQHELHANEVRLMRERNQDPLALPQFNHLSVPPSYPYQSQMNHQTSSVPQIAYQSPQVSTQPMTESPLMDSSLAVLGRQGQSYYGTGYKSNATSSRGNNASGQARVVKCYNCQGEGHMAKQCIQPKQPRNATWYKDKTEDLDTYDSDCDDISNAKAVLMANISIYSSDVISEVVQIFLWYLDSGCLKHMTRNHSQLVNFVSKFLGTGRFGNDHIARIIRYGDYQLGNVTISRVYYVEGLGDNLFSVGQFCDADLEVAFWKNTCFIRNLEDEAPDAIIKCIVGIKSLLNAASITAAHIRVNVAQLC
ncbi:retrovirus-related pol polyprotein from transposon TNT 1-94 [Tanacetum coccineum]